MSLPGHTLYAIGKIEKAFGVKGDVVIQIMTGPVIFVYIVQIRVAKQRALFKMKM